MDQLIKRLFWLYFLLWVGEGVLRKWVVPSLSEPLLIIRDPVVLAIYLAALMRGRFPLTVSTILLLGFAAGSLVFAALSGAPWLVTLYGLRINYMHLPLIFILADMLDKRDVLAFGRVVLWLSLPIGLLMVMQYRAGEGSWLNVSAGGDFNGQLSGALGRVRPPGPFSFITGPVLWFSLATAFTFYGWINRGTYPFSLLVMVTGVIVVVVPISISRMLLFSVLVVVAFGGMVLMRSPQRALAIFIPALLIALTFGTISGGEMTDAFQARWDTSTSSGVQASIFDRFFHEHLETLNVISHAPIFGHGIGMGSNVGARFTTGEMGFQLAESEWPKIVLELGPLLGVGFILYRGWLGLLLLFSAWRVLLQRGDGLPWMLCGACLLPVVSGQWAPPTILGYAVFTAGLVLASTRLPADEAEDAIDELSVAAEPCETEAPFGEHQPVRRRLRGDEL